MRPVHLRGFRRFLRWGWLFGLATQPAAAPIHVHPDYPHYFVWRGRPTILITSGEHYGAVLNLDFDYGRYLDELQVHGFNLTRTFSGTYREVPGSFNIMGNTLAPAADRFLCPWARSDTPGAADGGNKFDLTRWDSAYFERLKDFLAQAGEHGVVVELVLFCTMYDQTLWTASPMHPRNNVNGLADLGPYEVYRGKDPKLLAIQCAVVRKLVTELNPFNNLYYEICNEPYERGGLTREWNDQIIATIVDTEAALPNRHLIAQGFPAAGSAVNGLNPHVAVLNFHAASPDVVRLNYPLNRVLALDETGGADRSDRKYRTDGWRFILAGGGVYDHLDFSFTLGHEDGSAVPLPPGTPGGGGPDLRRQLGVLKRFIEGFDFIRMAPHKVAVTAHAGAAPARDSAPVARPSAWALAEVGEAYAVYVTGGPQTQVALELPAGSYRAEWVNTLTGDVELGEKISHTGGTRTLTSPPYAEDIALRLQREPIPLHRSSPR